LRASARSLSPRAFAAYPYVASRRTVYGAAICSQQPLGNG
jgi:hypothetical protein